MGAAGTRYRAAFDDWSLDLGVAASWASAGKRGRHGNGVVCVLIRDAALRTSPRMSR